MEASLPPLSIPVHVGPHLKRALRLAEEGDHAGSLEALAAAAVIDIQAAQQEFLGDIRACAVIADVTRAALEGWTARQGSSGQATVERHATTGASPSARRTAGDPVRVLYFAPNLASGQAASMNLVRLVEWHVRHGVGRSGGERLRVEVAVVVCDELTERTPALGYLRCPQSPTSAIGAELLARLRQSCTVTVLPANGTHLDGATAGIAAARAFAPDVALFMGSPACAVQTAIAAARVAPVQACLNIGVPMLSPGIDAVIYNNPSKEARDAAFVCARGLEVLGVATSGGDAQVGAALAPFPRSELGLPDAAPVAVSMSNVLVRRMLAGTFARDLVAFLRRNPDVWWLGIGFCDPAPFYQFLETVEDGAEIRRRCVFAGGSSKPWSMVKSCQVLLNEYPEGGGNSVIETMGCGVPVVAMRAGHRHAESIGAELVGEDAIQSNDITAYWRLAERWIRDPAAAATAGARQRARAMSTLDYGVICDAYERIAVDLFHRRVRVADAGASAELAAVC
jgi:glycosyltransferase involved in cell wall biosynthesis